MKRIYIQPIILFGIALPLITMLVLALIISSIKSSYLKGLPQSRIAYQNDQALSQSIQSVKQEYQNYKDKNSNLQEIMSSSGSKSVIDFLTQATWDSKSKTMMLAGQSRIRDTSSYTSNINTNAEGLNLTIDGTFKELQESMIALEYSYPNLYATNLSIKPGKKSLEVQLNYLIWKPLEK